MIYCIRHGETDWNRTMRIQGASNIPLNSLGRQQAVAVAEIVSLNDCEHLYKPVSVPRPGNTLK
ncbi:histidine phosphatase family protein [Bacillus fonticola]|uniref:histidine phosphatase family protein n=1 Tax=Bacillus fonticola TaxID=2728853 RepID=UPI0014749A4D|nr:histidine phosphatase family protein [Bacillus fonticola]